MSKKKLIIILVSSLTLIGILAWAVPAMAADSGAPSARNLPQAGHFKVLLRLLLVQDEAKVDALLARAEDAGKLTPEQVVKIKTFWTNNHTRFARNFVLKRLLGAKDGDRVQQFLDQKVTAGKIKPEQAEKIIQIWEILHAPSA